MIRKLILNLILSGIVFSSNAQTDSNKIPPCNPSMTESTVCYINNISKLRATQFNYGEQYVNGWVEQYRHISPNDYQKILNSHFFPIIIAPNKTIFLADGHHRLRATQKLSDLQHHQYRIYLKVQNTFPYDKSVKSNNTFWQWMTSSKNVWLEDEGATRDKNFLPKSILGTTNDKYRTLAGWLIEARWCYNAKKEDSVNYIEFFGLTILET